MVCRTSFLSRQSDVIASFFVWRELVHTDFHISQIFVDYCCLLQEFFVFFILAYLLRVCRTICYPQVRRGGSCGHAKASFDGHSYCARCRDKGKGEEPCISNKETADCKFCNALTPEQRTQLATPSYKLKKEKREAKRSDSNPADDPATVSVIGAVGDSSSAQASSAPSRKEIQER